MNECLCAYACVCLYMCVCILYVYVWYMCVLCVYVCFYTFIYVYACVCVVYKTSTQSYKDFIIRITTIPIISQMFDFQLFKQPLRGTEDPVLALLCLLLSRGNGASLPLLLQPHKVKTDGRKGSFPLVCSSIFASWKRKNFPEVLN